MTIIALAMLLYCNQNTCFVLCLIPCVVELKKCTRFHWYKIHVEIAHRRNSTKFVGIQACDETGRAFIFVLPANFFIS